MPVFVHAQVVMPTSSHNDYKWMNVGTAGFSGGPAIYTTIKFSPGGQAYVAFADWGYGKNISVMKYNGTDWVSVGDAGFSENQAIYTNLAFSPAGVPFVVYSDVANLDKTTVKKYDETGVGMNEPLKPGLFVYPNPATNKVTIERTGTGIQSHISIADMIGNVIIARNITENPTLLDVGNLPAGVYILQLRSGNAILTTRLCKN